MKTYKETVEWAGRDNWFMTWNRKIAGLRGRTRVRWEVVEVISKIYDVPYDVVKRDVDSWFNIAKKEDEEREKKGVGVKG